MPIRGWERARSGSSFGQSCRAESGELSSGLPGLPGLRTKRMNRMDICRWPRGCHASCNLWSFTSEIPNSRTAYSYHNMRQSTKSRATVIRTGQTTCGLLGSVPCWRSEEKSTSTNLILVHPSRASRASRLLSSSREDERALKPPRDSRIIPVAKLWRVANS